MKEGQPKAIELSDYAEPAFLIETTELDVDIFEESTRVRATLRMRRNPNSKEPDADLKLHGGPGLDTQSIQVAGKQLLSNEFQVEEDQLTLFDVPDEFELVTDVLIKPQDNTALEGLYKSGDMFCTQCEAEGFRNITWYLDRPDVMSKYTTTVRADRSKYPVLLSNGNAMDRGVDGERHWVTWEDPFKKPAYLFALVAGDLQHIEDKFVTMSGREVTLQIFTEARNIDKVDFAMTSLKNSMTWDEQTYGREYDLDIFMIVAVESFNMGAMENKGLNVFNTSCVLARPDTTTDAAYQRVESVVGHEYFHNWSGNRVTCRDWFQLSLKEGFTVLRDQQFSSDLGSPTVCRISDVTALRSAQFPEDAGPMAHPIRPASYIEINNFYTATVYEKGAEVVRMIRTLLGEDRFRAGTDLYFERHDGEAVTTEDFVRAMEDANGFDLSQFRYWYSQAGTPVLEVQGVYDEVCKTYTLNITQTCPATPGQESKQPFHLPIAIGLPGESGEDQKFTTQASDVAHIKDADNEYTMVLHLREATQTFVLEGVDRKPVPSLLRHFSAPVKLNFDYSRDDLVFLMSHDADGFNRWEAGQRLAVEVIQEIVGQLQARQIVEVDDRLVQAFEALLNEAVTRHGDADFDKAMLATMLILPGEAYLAELSEVADIDAIHDARNIVRRTLAGKLGGLLLSVYKLNVDDGPYQPVGSDIARRALKNAALAYLLVPEDTEMVSLCVQQFEQSNNMTDTSAAIRALVNCPAPAAAEAASKLLKQFFDRWSDDALVIDQWFNIQALSPLPGALERVKALMTHPAFTMKNPNRMRSVVSAFTVNTVNFHRRDGAGYEFLASRVIELNSLNPQMAARILSPLTRWRKVDADRQAKMKAQLQRILDAGDLSPDVFEVVSKSL